MKISQELFQTCNVNNNIPCDFHSNKYHTWFDDEDMRSYLRTYYIIIIIVHRRKVNYYHHNII